MARILVDDDCGNAPKQRYVRDFLVHCANADLDAAVEMLAEDVRICRPGSGNSAEGLDEAKDLLATEADRSEVVALKLENVISHGKKCAANGLLEFEDGSSLAFCGMYVFSGHGKRAKLESITSYSIEL